MSITQKIAWNTTVQIVGKVFSIVLSLAFIGIIGRLLGVEGVGQYTTVLAFLGMLAVFADFGFNLIMIRELTLLKYSEQEVAGNITLLRILLAVVVYSIGIFIGQFLHYPSIVMLGIIIVGIGQFMATIQTMVAGVFQAKYQMAKSVGADIIGKAVLVGFSWYISLHGGGIKEIFWGTTIGSAVTIAVSLCLVNKILPLRFRFNQEYWRYLFKEALPMGFNSILHFLYFKTDTLILSLIKSSFDVGIYGIPYKILEVILAIPGFFISSVLPVFTRYYKDNDPRIQTAFQKSLDFLILMAMPVVVGGIMLSRSLIGIAGPDFISASTVSFMGVAITPVIILKILLVGTGFSYISFVFIAFILAIGQQKKLIIPNIFYAVFNISANILLIPKYSYLAAATITALTEIAIFIVSVKITTRFITFKISWSSLPKAFFASMLMLVVLLVLPGENLLIEIPSAFLTYALSVWKMGLVDKDALGSIIRK